jgi:hypothetical protein
MRGRDHGETQAAPDRMATGPDRPDTNGLPPKGGHFWGQKQRRHLARVTAAVPSGNSP